MSARRYTGYPPPETNCFDPRIIRIGASGATATEGSPFGRILRTVNTLAELTGHLRATVEGPLAKHLEVTGWQDSVLRVHLDEPGLVTRWRFLAPAVLKSLGKVPALNGIREIRLSALAVRRSAERPSLAADNSLRFVPIAALVDLAQASSAPGMKRALEALAESARQAQRATRQPNP